MFRYIAIFEIKPDTALVFLVGFSFLRNDVEGALMGLFAGLMRDILFGQFVGYYALMYALIGYVCGKPFKDFYRENYLFPVLLTFLSIFALEFTTYVTHFMLLGRTDTLYYTSKIILPSVAYTTACVFPLYFIVYKINKKLEERLSKR